MIGVQPARIRKNPQPGLSNSLLLTTGFGSRPVESCAICAEPKHSDPSRLVFLHFALQSDTARTIFVIIELRGCRRGSSNDCRNSISRCKELIPLARMKKTIRKSSGVECRPEPVAGSCEMQCRSTGIESRIYSAEEDLEIRRNQIGYCFPMRASELFGSRSAKDRLALHIRGRSHFMPRTTKR